MQGRKCDGNRSITLKWKAAHHSDHRKLEYPEKTVEQFSFALNLWQKCAPNEAENGHVQPTHHGGMAVSMCQMSEVEPRHFHERNRTQDQPHKRCHAEVGECRYDPFLFGHFLQRSIYRWVKKENGPDRAVFGSTTRPILHGCRLLLQFQCCWEQDIVLQVYVCEQIVLKLLEQVV